MAADDPGPVEWAKYKALQAENTELKREIEFLGKSAPSSPQATIGDYYVFIRQEKANYKIDWMCQQLKVPRSSYYRWTMPKELTPTQVRHSKRPGGPGHGGCHHEKQGLRAVRMRAWKKTTVVDPAARTGLIRNHMQDGEGNRAGNKDGRGHHLPADGLRMAVPGHRD